MDKSAFPAVLKSVRKLSGGFPGGTDDESTYLMFGGQALSEASLMLDDALTDAQKSRQI